ncbi:diadenylate cyclase [Paludisphaera mucosa]|uniref:Diadenylate cyclase n=1 Tax=Paludisphaera mucosa TaxID=3030827 RepID=A0ABT6F9G1_9BACT|nr:diadenylate cyclase [Paludisphaera mucosa]MDG3004230.1 diadenylate cyclase [Paludisphaera mucosa]
MTEQTMRKAVRFDAPATATMAEQTLQARPDRHFGPASKVVGLYQAVMRRTLEHFFPDSVLEIQGDRSIIDWDVVMQEAPYRITDDPDRLAIDIEWRGTRLTFQPGSPIPLFLAERRMIDVIVRALDHRFRALFDLDIADRVERFNYLTEDLIIADFLATVGPFRIPAALEALRVAALSTYENRRVTTGALLLGTSHDPTTPGRENLQGAPQFNARLTAIKGFHRLCDGVRTVFVVDPQGELVRIADIARWAERTQVQRCQDHLCPRPYQSHARATISGGHVCVVLTPSQEIKVFAEGELAFSFSDGRWRLLDIPTKFAVWQEAVEHSSGGDLARRLFQAALNLSEARVGALLVVVRDPEKSIPQLIAPIDRMNEEIAVDDPQDPENLSPRLAKRALHHAVRGMTVSQLEPTVLEAIASLDGAVVADPDGMLVTFGAILRINPEVLDLGRSVQGARTLAALAASQYGPVLKVSEDGYVTMFLKGRRVWEF